MKERCLTEGQKGALGFLGEVLVEEDGGDTSAWNIVINKKPLAEAFGLDTNELTKVVATLGLVFHYASRETGGKGIDPRVKRRFAAALVNNHPGSRQIYEEEHGKLHIPGGYSRTGRNHGGRARATR